jgi:copper chaperone NosL
MLKSKLILQIFLLLFILLILNACSKSPEEINYGEDECEYCKMLITDNKYGAEIITDKGKTYKFDSIECLIGFASVKNLLGGETQNLLVSDFSNPGNFTDARNAHYVQNDNYRSPMGLNVSAFGDKSKSDKFISDNGGQNLGWLDVIQLVMQKDM